MGISDHLKLHRPVLPPEKHRQLLVAFGRSSAIRLSDGMERVDSNSKSVSNKMMHNGRKPGRNIKVVKKFIINSSVRE
jgi:hypothetical protein